MPSTPSISLKILFVSRAYPPIVGGIENQNFGIATSLSKVANVTIFANHGGKKALWWWLPWAKFRIFWTFWRYDVILLGDGALAPITLVAIWCSRFTRRKTKVVSIIHGLDVTFFRKPGFLSKVYRFVNIPALRQLDLLIAVGNQTRDEAMSVGVDPNRVVFIPNGVFIQDLFEPHTREELARVINPQNKPGEEVLDITDKKIVLRIGRYVQHKGVEWFIRNVVPHLPSDVLFVAAGAVVTSTAAGDGSYYPHCQAAVRELGLEKRVKLLTNLPWDDMKILFNTVDLVVSPNIPVKGTMEGFGINVIEAASCERVVVASALEGLKDAIIEGANGFLVEPGDAAQWSGKITELLAEKDAAFRHNFGIRAREFSTEHFRWETIARQYLEALERVFKND